MRNLGPFGERIAVDESIVAFANLRDCISMSIVVLVSLTALMIWESVTLYAFSAG